MNMIKNISTVFSFLLMSSLVIAQTSNIVWPITSVDLYQSGAMIEHSDSVEFDGKSLKLYIRGIATGINRNSIQVDLPNGIVLESLSYKKIDSDNPNRQKIKTLNDSINTLNFQKKMYEALLHTLNEERLFLQANREIGSDQEVLLVDDIIEMADFLRERNQDLGLEILDVQIDIEATSKKLSDLISRKNSLLNSGQGKEGEVKLVLTNISGVQQSEFITIRYMTSKAGWTPEYSLFFEEGEVFVKRQARLQQKSGVDWNGVEIALLSGKPAESLKPNGFDDWVIEEIEMSSSMLQSDAAYAVRGAAEDEDEEIEFDKNVSYAGETKYSFNIDGEVNLKSSRFTKKFEIGSFILEGDVKYYAAPAINPSAYAMVSCSDWADKELMPGKANVNLSSSYLGWYNLILPVVGDTLDINLGNDPHVLCSRKLKTESSSTKRFAGKKQVVQTIELSIENTHSDSVHVDLADKLPRAKQHNSEVQISAITEYGGYVDSARNEIKFDIVLAPLERRTVTYVLTVTYPSSMKLKNL